MIEEVHILYSCHFDDIQLLDFDFKRLIIFIMPQTKDTYPQIYTAFRNPWAQIDPFLLGLFVQKFPTQNKAVFNYASSTRLSTLLISNKIIKKNRDRVSNFQSQQQADLKIQLPLSSYLWLKFSTDEVKLHYHNGEGASLAQLGTWQPYVSFSSTRKFKNSSFKLGVLNQFSQGLVDFRLRYNVGQHRAENFYYAKGVYLTDIVKFSAIVTTIRKLNQTNLQKNDLMTAFRIVNNNWFGVIFNTDGFRNYKINYSRLGSYFDSMKAVYLLDLPSLRMGLLYEYSIEDSNSKKIEAAVEYRSQQTSLKSTKLRLNTLWEMGLTFEAVQGSWRVQGGASWFNISKSIWPSYYSLGFSYY